MEPDYVSHLTRAQRALEAVYPQMCERRYVKAIQSAIDAQVEISRFIAWIVAHSKG